MSIIDKYDYIIIGAGCAGLSLAYRMLNKDFKVCVIEKESNISKKNKLWSFWDTYENPFNHLVEKKWSQFLIQNESKILSIDCHKFKYKSLNSHDFNNYILEKIRKSKNIDINFSLSIEKINKNGKEIEIKTKEKVFLCNHIFDSRPNFSKVYMWQQFFGGYVKTSRNVFDESSPIIMDFSNIEKKFHFNYFLPFKKNLALIESTYFSSISEEENLDIKYIEKYMETKYKGVEYNIEKTESGRIPMDVNLNSNCDFDYITKIGSYSGVTRASTGYAFINIQKQSDYIMQNLSKVKKIKKYHHNFILRKMDDIFLKILKDDPEYIKKALIKLFSSKNSITQIKFLSDIPNIVDIIKILIYLPKKKFLQYALGIHKNENK